MHQLTRPVAITLLLAVLVLGGCQDAPVTTTQSTVTIDDGPQLPLQSIECQQDVRVDDGPPGGLEAFGQLVLMADGVADGPDGPITVEFGVIRIGQDLLSDVLFVDIGPTDNPSRRLDAVKSDLESPRETRLDVTVADGPVVSGTATMLDQSDPPAPAKVAFTIVCPT